MRPKGQDMATKNQPSKATVEKVAEALGAVPRSVSAIGNEVNLAPSTTRKALVVLAEQGRVAKTDQGDWHAVTAEPRPTPIKEPTALTRSALGKLSRDELVAWATSCSLLEHLSEDDLAALGTKAKVVAEVTGALLRVEVAEDHRAAATDEVARPVAELIGFTPAARPAKPAKAAKAAKKASRADEVPNPLEGLAAKLAALGLSDRLARRGGALVELVASEGPLTEDECRAKLGPLSSWDFRRLVAGEHGDRRFDPLLTVEGKGSDRKYAVVSK